MTYDFETLVNRENVGNMKNTLAPPDLCEKGQIVFAGAEMDFKTAPVIINALKDFASRGIYGFTLADKPYMDAVCWWMKNARGFAIDTQEIVPTLGTIFALGTAIRAFTEPGDGVIIQHPVYYRYETRITTNGRQVVSAPLEEQSGVYKINYEVFEMQMAKPENKLLVLCNPHNPIGKVFERDELVRISTLANKYRVIVFSDEIFGEIAFDGHRVVPYLEIDPDHAITCTSLGKVFNLTGVNQANVLIRNENIRKTYFNQRAIDHFGSIDPFFYSAVLAGYSPEGLAWVREMKEYVWDNYIFIKEFFDKRLPRLGISPLEGGFVIWTDFRGLGLNDSDLKLFLEQEARVFIDEGIEYGSQGSGFCRMNIASPRLNIERCLESLYKAYKEHGY